ncbi:MAG: response regulator [Verrucomicrobiota bacterium]
MTTHLQDEDLAVLYIDDETKSLKYFRKTFEDRFPILTARNAAEGYRVLVENRHRIGVVLTDQRMPGASGVDLLERVRQLEPDVIRMLVTAYSTTDTAIDAVNSGAVFRYLTKPWNPRELESGLAQALEYFSIRKERDALLNEKMENLRREMMADRAASMKSLAAGLNHHMRNALTSIKTFVDLVPDRLAAEQASRSGQLEHPEFWTDFRLQVLDQIGRLTRILERLGDAAYEDELAFDEWVCLPVAVDDAKSNLADLIEQRQLRYRCKTDPDLPKIRVNGGKFRWLLELMFGFATRHLEPGGQLVVQLERDRENGRARTDRIALTFSNDNPPMAAGELPGLFNPFYQFKDHPDETGIDLMAAYLIVFLHGGEIEAINEGKATRIRITLPVLPTPDQITSAGALEARIEETRQVWAYLHRQVR